MVAANVTVLDERVQRNAGVGIQRAIKSVVLPQFWWAKNSGESSGSSDSGTIKHISSDNGGAKGSVPGDGDNGEPRLENDTNMRAGVGRDGDTDDTDDEYENEGLWQRPLSVLTKTHDVIFPCGILQIVFQPSNV